MSPFSVDDAGVRKDCSFFWGLIYSRRGVFLKIFVVQVSVHLCLGGKGCNLENLNNHKIEKYA